MDYYEIKYHFYINMYYIEESINNKQEIIVIADANAG